MSKNPYYGPEHFGLEMLSFEDQEASYDFDTLCFWATPDGRIFTASDSGCSCPTPFEDYEGETLDEVLPRLERVGSLEQAESIFKSWNSEYRQKTDPEDLQKVVAWFNEHFKQ